MLAALVGLRSNIISNSRSYAFKSDLKLKWVRPERKSLLESSKSEVLSHLKKTKESSYIKHFDKSKQLSEFPDIRSLYQLSNNPRRQSKEWYIEELTKEIQRHSLDYGSMEVKLSKMTAGIETLRPVVLEGPKNPKINNYVKQLIEKRQKYLKYLRRWDYKRFEWLLEKLDLVYKPHPLEDNYVTRKQSLRKLTAEHCKNIQATRKEILRKKMLSQQITFLKDSIDQLEKERANQIANKLTLVIPVDVIESYVNLLNKLETKVD